jgi:protein-S-isoprenylcysteine O-methyltransferase Ste14
MTGLENRIPPPIIGVVFGLVIWLISMVTPQYDISITLRTVLSIALVCCGFGCAIAGGIAFKKAQTTVNPLKPETASTLVNTGVFKYTRNPMYLGLTLLLLALTFYLFAPFSIVGVFAFVLYIDRFQIQPEERALLELFGDEFIDYKNRVGRWL